MSDINLKDLRKKQSKREEGSTSVSWKDGDGIMVFDGVQGVPGDAEIRALLIHVGKDPDDYHWEVSSVSWNSAGWQRDKEDIKEKDTAYTGPTCVVKIKIEQIKDSAFIRETEADIAALCKFVEKRRPAKSVILNQNGERSLIWCWSDLQAGKGEGGGSPALVNRMGAGLSSFLSLLTELEEAGRRPDRIYIVGMGDLVEQCEGHYAMQAFQVDLDRRQQMKLVRRLLLEAINALVDRGYAISLAAVPGNHGENRNSDGKAFTSWTDNDDIAIFEQVAEVLAANPERYKNVTVPKGGLDSEDLVVTLEISGVKCAFAHGHQFRNGANPTAKAEGWWKGQALGEQRVSDAKILLSAHYHHEAFSAGTGRFWFQCPAQDGGSAWFTYTSGQHSPAGMLVIGVGTGYGTTRPWGDFRII